MHWYNDKGELCEVELREAREKGYRPSVNEIIHEFIHSYGLDLYREKQMFLSALTFPRPEGVTDEEFYNLVSEDSKQHSEKAKQFGIEVHKCVTQMYNDDGWFDNTFDKKVYNAAEKIYVWLCQNKESCIIDFKTQETKDGKFKQPYETWVMQLCGYWIGLVDTFKGQSKFTDYSFSTNTFGGTVDHADITDWNNIKLINLMISSNEDIPIKPYIWKPEKVEWGYKTFSKMVELYWIYKKLGENK